MTINNLINFIDRHTNNGAIYFNKPWEEGKIEEEGIAFIHSFYSRDWLALRNFNFQEKTYIWVKCLIHLLSEARTEESRQMIIYIALNGTEENFLDAMECIRSFRRDVSIYTWLKLKDRSSKILSSRLNH